MWYRYLPFVKYNTILIFPGAILSGLSIFFILSFLNVPVGFSVQLSIIVSVLILGLTSYYSLQKQHESSVLNTAKNVEIWPRERNRTTSILFAVLYAVLLSILIVSSYRGASGLFVDWEKIDPFQWSGLAAAIAFCFFLPGFGLVKILSKRYKLRLVLQILLAYIFSILITGIPGYITASLGYPISYISIFLIASYMLVLFLYISQYNVFGRNLNDGKKYSCKKSLLKIGKSSIKNYSQVTVFLSLLALVALYTYYLNDGKIIVDQWYQHGRALSASYGLFRDVGASDTTRPPFFSTFLATYFHLSGSYSVNAYVAIGFLNITPVVAFYYFFMSWVPDNKKKAGLLASTLFMLSSGFGWMYVTGSALTSIMVGTLDKPSIYEIFVLASVKTFDIETPTTFIDVGHPDITTPLIIITLPAVFTLLGLTKELILFNANNNGNNSSPHGRNLSFKTFMSFGVVTSISFLGILSHDEFYLAIMVASLAMIVFYRILPKNINYSIFFISFLSAISLVILLDTFISPAPFYSFNPFRYILGFPLIILCFVFVAFAWSMYLALSKLKILNIFETRGTLRQIKALVKQKALKKVIMLGSLNDHQIRFLKLALGIVTVSAIAYFYLFTLLVWNDLSVNDVRAQIKEFSNVPWYFYPVKFGLTGLLALAFILSYLFKRFEKEIFVFAIIIVIAFFAGPYYDEHRFGKYIMASMAAFAALLLYKIISSNSKNINLRSRPLVVGILIGTVVTSCGLSIFMYGGWVELFTQKSEWIEGGRRDFPTASEIKLLDFLNNKIVASKTYNIALPEKETTNEVGFVTKIYGFSPTSWVKLLENPLILNASTLEGLYNLLDDSDVKFILIPKKSIIADTHNTQVSSANNPVLNSTISNALHFVVDNFPTVYEDTNYIILKVLPFTPPSSDGNVAFVYQMDSYDLSNYVSNTSVILPTNTVMFGSQTEESSIKNNSNYNNNIVVKRFNEQSKFGSSNISSLTLGGNASNINSKSITLWSNPIQSISHGAMLNNSKANRDLINYIESDFRIIDEIPAQNKSEQKNTNSFGTGILWEDNNLRYLVSISHAGLKLSRGPAETLSLAKHPDVLDKNKKQALTTVLSQNEEIKRQKGIWYNVKILILKTGVEIYVDDTLRIRVSASDYYPASPSERSSINNSLSRIGINTYYSKSEFLPIIVGHLPESESYSQSGYHKMSYDHYYPLSALALSKVNYDTYLDGDLAAFSKKYVVIPFDKASDRKNDATDYLEFVGKGGNLIAINSDNKFDGIISKLVGIKPGNLTSFNGIETSSGNAEQKKYFMNVTGVVRNIDINSSDNLTIKSYYVNKDNKDMYQNAVPFVIEKKYGNGKIIFVYAKGYFDSIFRTTFSNDKMTDIPNGQYFTNLSNINSIIGIPFDNQNNENKTHPITLSSMSRIIGDLKVNPMQTITINGSSLLFPDSISDTNKISIPSYNLKANSISVSSSNSQQLSLMDESLVNTSSTRTSVQNNNNSNWAENKSNTEVTDNNYHFKDMTIKNLKLYGGPFEIAINLTNSTRPIYFPITSSYDDYLAISIPRDFDVNIKFKQSNLTYAQLDMMNENEKNAFKRINVLGSGDISNDNEKATGQITLNKVRTDLKSVRYITVLMKDPQIHIISENKDPTSGPDDQSSSIQFRRNTPESVPTHIDRDVGDIKLNVDHVDNYDESFRNLTKTQFITYLKNDIQITDMVPHVDTRSLLTKLMSKMPGDISENAKQNGIEVPWSKVFNSILNLFLVLTIIFAVSLLIILSWYKVKLQSIR
jgi:hypothetical protein